jgi:hypothetical protein
MKITSLTSHLLSLLIVSMLLGGCGGYSVEHKLYGTWDCSAFLSYADVRQLSEEPMPDGEEMEITFKGVTTYHKGGRYSGDGEFAIRIKTIDGELPLRFYVRDAGEWRLHSDGKELVESSFDMVITPFDELTETFFKESADLAAFFQPVRGETTTSRILSISDTVMVAEENRSKITVTCNKRR